jgi:hypothetical protein
MRPHPLLLLALACGPNPAPGDTSAEEASSTGPADASTSTSTTGPTTGQPETTGEACLEDIHPGDLWGGEGPVLTCGAPELCPGEQPIWFELDGPDIFDGDLFNVTTVETDVERARCLVAALRDRTPGQFIFVPTHDVYTLHVYGLEIVDDLALTRSDSADCVLIAPEPKYCHVRERLRVLRPPQFFADCIDGDARDLWLCLYDSVEPEPACHPGPLACP